MYDMKKLAQLLKELEDQLVVCMRCGLCQSVCPLFAETGREADVARGKLALLDGLLQEIFKDPQGVNERLSRCLLCGSCAANCPSGVKVLDIFLKARAILAGYRGLSAWKKVLFRRMLAQPQLFDGLMELGARFQGFFAKPADDMLGTSCARFLSPLVDRHFKPLADIPFHRRYPALRRDSAASGLTVAFFVGCVIDKIYPNVGEAVLKSLAHHGVGVIIPAEMGCCGIPALSSGDAGTFNSLVRHNLKRLAAHKVDHIVTACATCTSTIRKLWPTLAQSLSGEEQAQVEALAERTMDISRFLVEKLGVKAQKDKGRVEQKVPLTYHDPCHLKKLLGEAAQPRAVLEANGRYRLVEMAEADRCCGCGGSFNLQHYSLSRAIGQRKRANIVNSGCPVVATSCPACMMQITDMLSQSGDRVDVRHTIEIYAESLV